MQGHACTCTYAHMTDHSYCINFVVNTYMDKVLNSVFLWVLWPVGTKMALKYFLGMLTPV